MLAAGAVLSAVDAVAMEAYHRPDSLFALTRPPGHHTGRDKAMGFCLRQPRLDRGPLRPGAVRDRARRGARLGRPPRQRDAGDPLGGPVGALRVAAPVAALSRHRLSRRGRRGRRRRDDDQRPAAAGRGDRSTSRRSTGSSLPAIEAFAPAPAAGLRRAGRPRRRPAVGPAALAGRLPRDGRARRGARAAARRRPRPGPRGRLQRHDAPVDRPGDRRGARRLRRPAGRHLRPGEHPRPPSGRERLRDVLAVQRAAPSRARHDRALRVLVLARDAGGRGARRSGPADRRDGGGGGRGLQRAAGGAPARRALRRRRSRRTTSSSGSSRGGSCWRSIRPRACSPSIAPWAREAAARSRLPLVAAVRVRHDGLSLHRRAGRRPRRGPTCSRRRPGSGSGCSTRCARSSGAALIAAGASPNDAGAEALAGARDRLLRQRPSVARFDWRTSSGRSCAGRSRPIRRGAGLRRPPSARTTACATCCRGRARTCG